MRERATPDRGLERSYLRARRAIRRFGTTRISTRFMRGHEVSYPSDWDEETERRRARRPDHERRAQERDRRLAEIERTL